MKLYLDQTVYDAALERIRRLFDEFPNVLVNVSGGKDSTVVYNLALQVAEEKGRLPLKVFFIDQEAEWQSVIDYIRVMMNDPRVEPLWLQVPIKIFNATSTKEPWLYCWAPGEQWIRDKEPNSIHDNSYGTDRFAELFEAYCKVEYPNTPTARLSGVRSEESPARHKGLTSFVTYKDITWGKVENKKLNHYVFYPLYDWDYTDVWKAIHDNNWAYCEIYDYMYQYGIPVRNMRVSNVHHETAVKTLYYLHELEGETWNKITARVQGANTVAQLTDGFFKPETLPPMFKDWWEYRDYLLENLIENVEHREKLRQQFINNDRNYEQAAQLDLVRTEIAIILVNDYHSTKLDTFHAAHGKHAKNRGIRTL